MEDKNVGRMQTVDMDTASKRVLFESNHPVIRLLKEIPEIVFPETQEDILHGAISLRSLFERAQMDQYHVDCLVLYQMAKRVLHIMDELEQRHIFPGLYALEDFYVHPGSWDQIWLLHPEKFQLLNFEQDYEWYPEDERVFGEITYFDETSQRLADTRLLYKILTASARGNSKIPPQPSRKDYAELFYKTLPPQWQTIFKSGKGVSHASIRALLMESIELEQKGQQDAFRHREDNLVTEGPESDIPEEETDIPRGCTWALFAILRTDTERAGTMSRLLYKEQDRLEVECRLQKYRCRQAFVYGNDTVRVREFAEYPGDFRCQLEQEIREYSAGEAMLIASELMRRQMNLREAADECILYLLTDGKLKNDQMFCHALDQICALREAGCEIRVISGGESQCEACQKLRGAATKKTAMKKGTQTCL